MDDVKRHVEIIRHCGNSKDGSACPECPFNLLDDEKDPCVNQLFRKSADLIEFLAAELGQVKQERSDLSIKLIIAESALKKCKRERDAAVKDLTNYCQNCWTCFFESTDIDEEPCKSCEDIHKPLVRKNWQWRGVKEG